MADTLPIQKNLFNPHDALRSFYHHYPCGVARVALWKWFIVTSKGNFKELSDKSQEEFATFFDALQDLIKAAYLLQLQEYQQQEKGGDA